MSADAPIGEAVARLRDGGLLAFPTETLWALGADATSEAAVARLFRWKGRGPDQPVAVLVEGLASLEALGCRVETPGEQLAAAFWPGSLCLVLPCAKRFARGIARADGAVGVRCSPHPAAAALARRLAREGVGPVTATSLNVAGAEPAATRRDALRCCGDGPDAPRLLDLPGPDAGGGPPSTVVDVTGRRPAVLRWGALCAAELAPVWKEIDAR